MSLLLVSCGNRGQRQDGPPPDYQVVGDNSVYEFKLKDGTQCVLTNYRGAITCNWRQ